MPVMLERWNDDRMDALATRVDDLDERMEKGFARVDAQLRDLRGEMRTSFDRIDDRFDRLHRMLFQTCVVSIAALVGVIGVPQL